MTSVGSSAQESRTRYKMILLEVSFKYPAPVSSQIPTVPSHSSYFSEQAALNACQRLVPGYA